MFDVSSLDLKDLANLEKEIKARKLELKNTELTKNRLKERCIGLFNARFPQDRYSSANRIPFSENLPKLYVTDAAVDAFKRTTNAIVMLCDVALGNYRLTEWRTGVDQSQALRIGNAIPKDISENYQEMYDEIWAIFEKYAATYDERRNAHD